ncbi:MAG: choice-of-anchor D domain-containing protein, partial [Gammaproteobacteria bacterium]|nr:choice-of-anchor D domain-containing protein [Gammaproteobacteria bacterium]
YSANILVNSNDPVNPQATATADLHVTGAPAIGVTEDSLDYGIIFTVETDTLTFGIQNTGTDVLTVTGMTNSTGEFNILGSTSFTLNAGETQDVDVTFHSAVAGTFTDTITIASDASNGDAFVYLTGTTVLTPVVGATPDSLSFALASNTVDSLTLTITNSGGGPLYFTLSLAQSDRSDSQAKVDENNLSTELLAAIARRSSIEGIKNAGDETDPVGYSTYLMPDNIEGEEIFGSTASPWSGTLRDRGNIFYVNTSTTLLEHKFYLSITTSTQLNLFVYQGTAATGTFNKISDIHYASSGTGAGFYTSGPINVPLEAGYYYYIGASWDGSAEYYRGTEVTPLSTSFGTLETGIAGNIAGGYPPGATATNSYASGSFSPYYCAITTGSGWISTNPDAGTVAPGGQTDVQVIANTNQMTAGDYLANVIIESNDPDTPEYRVPVSLQVGATGIDDLINALPTKYALHQNFPNPFNP